MKLLSIDPGSEHSAWAVWELQGERWKCRECYELKPDGFLDLARGWIEKHEFNRVAIEEFKLFGDKALAQTGSKFGTVEVIGVVRHLCRWNDVPFEEVTSLARDAALIKMKAVKYKFVRDKFDHKRAAVCVGAVATGWRAVNHFEGDGVG